jgi:hypothetical protein
VFSSTTSAQGKALCAGSRTVALSARHHQDTLLFYRCKHDRRLLQSGSNAFSIRVAFQSSYWVLLLHAAIPEHTGAALHLETPGKSDCRSHAHGQCSLSDDQSSATQWSI